MDEPPHSIGDELPTLSTTFLQSVRNRDSGSWERLVLTFGPVVYRWCRCSGIREVDASDIVQDVFLSIARGLSGFEKRRETGSFRAWIATITRSRVRDYLRREARHEEPRGGSEQWDKLMNLPDDLDSTICSDGISSHLAQRVLEIIRSEFEETTWQAFWMTTIEDLSPTIVADRLGISLASVYQARSRVLRTLRTRLAELPE